MWGASLSLYSSQHSSVKLTRPFTCGIALLSVAPNMVKLLHLLPRGSGVVYVTWRFFCLRVCHALAHHQSVEIRATRRQIVICLFLISRIGYQHAHRLGPQYTDTNRRWKPYDGFIYPTSRSVQDSTSWIPPDFLVVLLSLLTPPLPRNKSVASQSVHSHKGLSRTRHRYTSTTPLDLSVRILSEMFRVSISAPIKTTK